MMSRLYGHRWTTSFGDDIDPGNVWAVALRGLTMDDINSGLNSLIDSGYDWPPSAIEFRKMCKKKRLIEIGLEPLVIAYKQLSDWSALTDRERCPTKLTPVLWWIYQQIGRHSWMNMPERDQKRAFREYYETAKAMADAGEIFPMPEPLPEYTQIEQQPADTNTASQALQGIKSIFK